MGCLSPYQLQIIFVSLFFWLFTFAINLWHRKFVTAVFVDNQHGIQRWRQDFYHASICEDGLGSCNSVRLSVRPSVHVSVTCVDCDKTKWCTADTLIPHERAITLLLWHQQWLVGDALWWLSGEQGEITGLLVQYWKLSLHSVLCTHIMSSFYRSNRFAFVSLGSLHCA